MATFDFRTKGKLDPHGKPRFYFVCHPDDFNRKFNNDSLPCFEKICDDILNVANIDCAIFFTPDMKESLEIENIDADLGNMNLFVIAVSHNMLKSSDENLQVNVVLDYVKRHNKNILPLMMDRPTEDLLSEYSKPEKFGKMQYIDPYDENKNISYETNLIKYFEKTILSPKLIEEVRSEFDASVFLSYRKKDRIYAKQLMKIIHDFVDCYDIAIWYDEFLPLGEDWERNIRKAMNEAKRKGNLFTLVVTPSVLEYVNGKKNFVLETECPDAYDMGMDILPVEMMPTNQKKLHDELTFLPDCVNVDSLEFIAAINECIAKIGDRGNDDSPRHIFLIGLAYLHGIEVELDFNRAVALIEKAAEMGYSEAMDMLYKTGLLFENAGNYDKAMEFYDKSYLHQYTFFGSNDERTILSEMALATVYLRYQNKFYCQLAINSFELILTRLAPNDPKMRTCFSNIGAAYNLLDEPDMAIEYLSKARDLSIGYTDYADEMLTRLDIDMGLAYAYSRKGEYALSLKVKNELLDELLKFYDEDHYKVIKLRGNIAASYHDMKEYRLALEMNRRILEDKLKSKHFGPNHPSTLVTQLNMVANLSSGEDIDGAYDEALELAEKTYKTMSEVFSEPTPDMWKILYNKSRIYNKRNQYANEINCLSEAARLVYQTKYEETVEGIKVIFFLGAAYWNDKQPVKGIENIEKAYCLSRRYKQDERHKRFAENIFTQLTKAYDELFQVYIYDNNFPLAHEQLRKLYKLLCDELGKDHPETVNVKKIINKMNGKFKKRPPF